MKKIDLDIYTPYGHYLSDQVDYLKVSSEKYTLGILPNHSPLVSTVTICEIVIQKDDETEHYATSGGIIRVLDDSKVELVLNAIESQDEIDLERAEAARDRAQNRLNTQGLEPLAITRSRLALARAMNRIKIKKGIE